MSHTPWIAGGALVGLASGLYLVHQEKRDSLQTLTITTLAGTTLALTAQALSNLLSTNAASTLCLSSLAAALLTLHQTKGQKKEERQKTLLLYSSFGLLAPIVAFKAKESREKPLEKLLQIKKLFNTCWR